MRRSLVASQFVISISLIAGTIVIKKQMDFLQNQKLGFDKDQILVINQADVLGSRAKSFMEMINQMPWEVYTSSSQYLPGDEYDSMGFIPEQPANFEHTSINYNFVDDQHLNVLDLNLKSGRNFDSNRLVDSLSFLINEKAAKMLGWDQPLGKKLSYDGVRFGQVVGIMEDYHYESMHSEVDPLILVHSVRPRGNVSIKINTSEISKALESVQQTWMALSPKAPLNYSFLDDDFDSLYIKEGKMSSLFSWSTMLAIFVACLGLYGLAIFNAERRTKEIGVRKILGASVPNILSLMTKEYFFIIVLALILSIPITWHFTNKWLMEFAYSTSLSWWIFAIAGLITMLVSILTIGFQSIKVAYSGPVDNLRVE